MTLLRHRILLPAKPEQRRLAAVFFVNSLGTGAYTPIALIFLIRVAHWSPADSSLAIGVGGFIAMFASLITGWVADKVNSRSLAAALFVCQGLSMCGLCIFGRVRSFLLLIVVLAIISSANIGIRPVWGVLISEAGQEDRVRLRAQLRAISNIAIAGGGLLAGVVLEFGTASSLDLLVLANALSFFVAALLLPRTTGGRPASSAPANLPSAVLHDKRFVGISCLNIILTWEYSVMMIALPVWIILRSSIPHWVAGAAIAINALLVVVLQVPASSKVGSPTEAAAAVRLAGVLFLLACIGFTLAGQVSAIAAVLLIGVAAVVHTVGEVFHASAAFEIPYALATPDALGKYQGVFETARGASVLSAPAVLTLLCVSWGILGWLMLGVLFVASGFGISWLIGLDATSGSDHARGYLRGMAASS